MNAKLKLKSPEEDNSVDADTVIYQEKCKMVAIFYVSKRYKFKILYS